MAGKDDAQSEMVVSAKDYADCRLLTISGRVDHTNADAFLNELTNQADAVIGKGGMVIDLTGLEFITSAGLRALFLTNRKLTDAGAAFVLSGIKGVVREVFRISNFDTLMTVAGTPKEALSQISAAAADAYAG